MAKWGTSIVKVAPALDDIPVEMLAESLDEKEVRHAREAKEKRETNTSWNLRFFQKFSADTTFHGIRYLFEPDSFIIRKSLWAIIVLLCTGFCIQQFYQRISVYVAVPTSVDLQVRYTTRHKFPQIVLCNLNIFKSTNFEILFYKGINKLFSASDYTDPVFLSNLTTYDTLLHNRTGQYLNLTKEYIRGQHTMKDMLLTCTFRGRTCSEVNFTRVFTDFGLCYQFIGDGQELTVSNSGIGTGLIILLNIEQYAYMYGTRQSAGILMAVQSAVEVPLADEKGFAVSTGGESLVSLAFEDIEHVPPPDGTCGTKPLQYLNLQYTASACRLECLTNYVVGHCGCRDSFMPGNVSLCHIGEYYTCSYPYRRNFSLSKDAEQCDCPPGCTEYVYTPSVTYAAYSSFMAKQLATSLQANTPMLLDFIRANDIYSFYFDDAQARLDLKAMGPLLFIVKLYSDIATGMYKMFDQFGPLSGLLAAFNSHPNPALAPLATAVSSFLNLSNFIASEVQLVDPNVYGPWWYSPLNLTESVVNLLSRQGRTLAFEMFRWDSTTSQNATTFKRIYLEWDSLDTSFSGSLSQLATIIGLISQQDPSPMWPAVLGNITLAQGAWAFLSPKMKNVLTALINIGLPQTNLYSDQNITRISEAVLDEQFVRDNLLKVEVFFKDMRYQSVKMQLTDSPVSLMCDLGGTFGLWLGASLMSLYELLDLLMNYLGLRYFLVRK